MSKKPYARDWTIIDTDTGLQYSPSKGLYWLNGRAYDELSARHNGLIGMGAALRHVIEDINQYGLKENHHE